MLNGIHHALARQLHTNTCHRIPYSGTKKYTRLTRLTFVESGAETNTHTHTLSRLIQVQVHETIIHYTEATFCSDYDINSCKIQFLDAFIVVYQVNGGLYIDMQLTSLDLFPRVVTM